MLFRSVCCHYVSIRRLTLAEALIKVDVTRRYEKTMRRKQWFVGCGCHKRLYSDSFLCNMSSEKLRLHSQNSAIQIVLVHLLMIFQVGKSLPKLAHQILEMLFGYKVGPKTNK